MENIILENINTLNAKEIDLFFYLLLKSKENNFKKFKTDPFNHIRIYINLKNRNLTQFLNLINNLEEKVILIETQKKLKIFTCFKINEKEKIYKC